MIQNITLGRYLPGGSVLHRLDPRTKIIGISFVIAAMMFSGRIPVLLGSAVAWLVMGRMARLPMRLLCGNIGPLVPILVLTLAFNAFGTSGYAVLDLPVLGLSASLEGIERGIYLGLRLLVLVLGVALLTLTTSPLELADGLEALFHPLVHLRVPVHELAMTATIALRFIPMLADEAIRIRNAQMSRGASFTGGPIRRARAALPILLPLFLSAFSRADRLATAMEARAYQGSLGRSRFRKMAFGMPDVVAFAASLAAVAVLAGTAA